MDLDVRANVHGTMLLKDIKCPICDRLQKAGDSKLRTRTGFSKVKCKAKTCGEVVQSSWWKCRCGIPWIKCPRHVLSQLGCASKRPKVGPSIGAQRLATYGVDRPLPVFKPAVISETSSSDADFEPAKVSPEDQQLESGDDAAVNSQSPSTGE